MNNKVELIGTYGSDKTHALSAWTSTNRELTVDKQNRIASLLDMLAKEGHHSVFEKSSIHFLVTTDIATHIHLLKHRIGVSINTESARYKELKDDKFYVPYDWDEEERAIYIATLENSFKLYHEAYNRLLAKGFSKKRAKESARLYIPYGSQLVADVMFNFRSFYHFLQLRYSKHAQREVSNLAKDMLIQVQNTHKFDKTLCAFGLVDKDGNLVEEFA